MVFTGRLTIVLLLLAGFSNASETVTVEPDGDAYHFVSHYRVDVEAPPADVWAVLIDLPAWMYEFDVVPVQGDDALEGRVYRLYEGQDFFVQVTDVVPERMLSVANLPVTFRGELGTGVGVFTLHARGDGTEVSLTMSRRYERVGEGYSELKETRSSAEFQHQTRAMWQERFLERLRELAQAKGAP